MRRFLPLLALAAILAVPGASFVLASGTASPPVTGLQAPPFTLAQAAAPRYADVAPIFAKHCVMCHSGPKAAAGLSLDSLAGILKGTPKEKMVIPGSPAKSELVQRIKGTKTPRMPKNGPPWLTDQETTTVEKWIAAGAGEAPKARLESPVSTVASAD